MIDNVTIKVYTFYFRRLSIIFLAFYSQKFNYTLLIMITCSIYFIKGGRLLSGELTFLDFFHSTFPKDIYFDLLHKYESFADLKAFP